jgi:hypothetical protein
LIKFLKFFKTILKTKKNKIKKVIVGPKIGGTKEGSFVVVVKGKYGYVAGMELYKIELDSEISDFGITCDRSDVIYSFLVTNQFIFVLLGGKKFLKKDYLLFFEGFTKKNGKVFENKNKYSDESEDNDVYHYYYKNGEKAVDCNIKTYCERIWMRLDMNFVL